MVQSTANSNYNSLQLYAQRAFAGWYGLSVAYTWSKSIDDSSDRYDGSFVNSYAPNLNRASSNFDQRHMLNIGYVYDLPFLRKPGLSHAVLGGWQWSGIVAFSYGAAASNFLSRGVKFASDAGSIVDCMQPPSTTPALNRTANNPLVAIFFLFPGRPCGARNNDFRPQLTEKAPPLLWFPAFPQCFLWTCCRNAALDFRGP